MYIYNNPNPDNRRVGDCVVRAISIATNKAWETVYVELMLKGLQLYDMPSSNAVWNAYLSDRGFVRDMLPDGYTVARFAADHPRGIYLLGTGSHVVAVIGGDYYDTWDSGDEVPVFVWSRKEF